MKSHDRIKTSGMEAPNIGCSHPQRPPAKAGFTDYTPGLRELTCGLFAPRQLRFRLLGVHDAWSCMLKSTVVTVISNRSDNGNSHKIPGDGGCLQAAALEGDISLAEQWQRRLAPELEVDLRDGMDMRSSNNHMGVSIDGGTPKSSISRWDFP